MPHDPIIGTTVLARKRSGEWHHAKVEDTHMWNDVYELKCRFDDGGTDWLSQSKWQRIDYAGGAAAAAAIVVADDSAVVADDGDVVTDDDAVLADDGDVVAAFGAIVAGDGNVFEDGGNVFEDDGDVVANDSDGAADGSEVVMQDSDSAAVLGFYPFPVRRPPAATTPRKLQECAERRAWRATQVKNCTPKTAMASAVACDTAPRSIAPPAKPAESSASPHGTLLPEFRPLRGRHVPGRGWYEPLCFIPGCTEPATRSHPVVRSFGCCSAHEQRALTVISRSEPGVCKVDAFQREICGLAQPSPLDIFCCHGHGCQRGYIRPCFVCGDKEDEGELSPCPKAGCTAWAHAACRALLSRRVAVYWAGDKEWYLGMATVADAAPSVAVGYDDGTVKRDGTRLEEDLAAGPGCVKWLIPPGREPCVCVPGAAAEQSKVEDQMRTCAVCYTHDVRDGSEPGKPNHIIFCDACGISVHLWCYGQTSEGEAFGTKSVDSISFVCDHCRHSTAEEPAKCILCPRRGGLIRPLKKGGWAHPACVLYNKQTRLQAAPSHKEDGFCSRHSGCQLCFKDGFRLEKVQAGAHPACSVASCPAPREASAGLVPCGGCHKLVHVTCAQQTGSGWHLKLKEMEQTNATSVEVLCARCHDHFLDTTGTTAKYKRHDRSGRPADTHAYASDEEYAAAAFTFQDWCHGLGGMRRAGERCGGLCTGACDIDDRMRMTYLATFGGRESLHNLSKMGTDARVARSCDIIFCGFCCKPFSSACGKLEGFSHPLYGNNFELMAQALRARRAAGLSDRCLILENVPNLLLFLTLEQLATLGYHYKIYVVSGQLFRCANVRQRLVVVAFLDRADLEAFTPPPPQAAVPTPLSAVLKSFTVSSGRDLFIKPAQLLKADRRCHVVGQSYPYGAQSPTSVYGVNTPGTLVAVHPSYDALEKPLPFSEARRLHFGDVRKLHPDEILASLSFKPHELPRLVGSLHDQYSLACQTVCVNVFEAFAAEALAAMGKPGPRDKLRQSVEAGLVGASADWSERQSDERNWLWAKTSIHGVPYEEYYAMALEQDLLEEDELRSEHQLQDTVDN